MNYLGSNGSPPPPKPKPSGGTTVRRCRCKRISCPKIDSSSSDSSSSSNSSHKCEDTGSSQMHCPKQPSRPKRCPIGCDK